MTKKIEKKELSGIFHKKLKIEKKEHERKQATLRQHPHRQKLKEIEIEIKKKFNKPKREPHKRKNNLHNERMWARKDYQIFHQEGNPERCMVFLMKHQDKQEWLVIRRDFNVIAQESEADRRIYLSEIAAKANFQILSQRRLLGEDWYSIENYYDKAFNSFNRHFKAIDPFLSCG